MTPNELSTVNGLYAAWLRAKMFRDKLASTDIKMLSIGYMAPGDPPEAEIFFLMNDPSSCTYMREMVDRYLGEVTAQLMKLGARPPIEGVIGE